VRAPSAAPDCILPETPDSLHSESPPPAPALKPTGLSRGSFGWHLPSRVRPLQKPTGLSRGLLGWFLPRSAAPSAQSPPDTPPSRRSTHYPPAPAHTARASSAARSPNIAACTPPGCSTK